MVILKVYEKKKWINGNGVRKINLVIDLVLISLVESGTSCAIKDMFVIKPLSQASM